MDGHGGSLVSLSLLSLPLMLDLLCLRYKSRPAPAPLSPGDLPMASLTGGRAGAGIDNEVRGMGAAGLVRPLPS